MVVAVHAVADVVEVAGDGRKLRFALGIAKPLEDVVGDVRHQPHVPLPVLRVPDLGQRLVGLADVDLDPRVFAHFRERDDAGAIGARCFGKDGASGSDALRHVGLFRVRSSGKSAKGAGRAGLGPAGADEL